MESETTGIACPLCGSLKSDVIGTQDKGDYIRRRRVCLVCDNRYTTIETVMSRPKGKKLKWR